MQTFKLNDPVYTYFGYGNLQTLGKRKKRIVLFDSGELTQEQQFELMKARGKKKEEKKKFKEMKIKKYFDKKKKLEMQNEPKKEENQNEEQKLNQVETEINKDEQKKQIEIEIFSLFEQLPNVITLPSEQVNQKDKALQQQQQQQQQQESPIKKKFVNLVKVKLKNGSILELPENELRSKLSIYVKTFAESNKIYALNLSIQTSVSEIKNQIIAKLNYPKSVIASKLFNPINQLIELPNSLTLESGNIPNNAKLLLVVNVQLSWDPSYKGIAIQLINSNLTAQKNYENDFQTVLANYPLSAGKNYWEIKIDKSFELDDVFIGVAQKQVNLYMNPIKTNAFWGFICRRGQIFGPNFLQYYGFQAQIEDIIGILLEYKRGFAELSFYINGINCGIAFKNLIGEFYPAVSMYYSDVQVTLIPKPQFPYF